MALFPRPWILVLASTSLAAAGLNASGQVSAPAATTVIHFTPPSSLPDRAIDGTCRTPSAAAWFREDAWACGSAASSYDPCFRTGPSGPYVWCVTDPRQIGAGALLNATVLSVTHAVAPGHRAWFFELTDGSTCRPLLRSGRVVEGETELYGCNYAAGGEADALLGDLDSGAPLWTVHKVMLNKKTEPQTIKSLLAAPVRSVWQ